MGLFAKSRGRTVAIIDVSSASVGAGFAHMAPGTEPVFSYTCRVDVPPREGEEAGLTTLRGLDTVARRLVAEGIPQLARETGSGTIDQVFLTLGSPWQETAVKVVTIEEDRPFVFTRARLDAAIREALPVPEGRTRSDEIIVRTSLNGYVMKDAWNKRARRADTTVLASTLDTGFARDAEKLLRSQFHTGAIRFGAFAPASYAVMRDLFPHETEYLVLEVGGTDTHAICVKQGSITGTASVPAGLHTLSAAARGLGYDLGPDIAPGDGTDAIGRWLDCIRALMAGFAHTDALPRTVFLIADQSARDFLKQTLAAPSLRALWLSDVPLSIIPVTEAHLAPAVRARGLAEGDLYLALLAHYVARR